MERIKEHARAIRALIATAAAVALAALVINFEREHSEAQALAIHQLNGMLWSISELNFESQRLITALNGLHDGDPNHDEVKLRLDVLWSRVDVIPADQIGGDAGYPALIIDFRRFLEQADPIIYGEAPLNRSEAQALSQHLADLTVQSRNLWSKNLGTQDPAQRLQTSIAAKVGWFRADALALFLVGLLLAYVVLEVFVANRGHEREKALRLVAADANEAKSRFLANVSHEIRTPLNGILGMASELSESSLNEDQAQCLRVIEQSGAVLLATINDVLDLSRIEAGQLLVDERPFALRELVQAAGALYGARAREKGLALQLHVQENLPDVLLGDAVRIRQILHNLIANAVKFTATGGVTVRVRPELEGRRLIMAVQDSGPGIDRLAQKRVFEPFQQADASITRQHGGSGLGLSISRQLCHAMGGELSVVSRPGHGATFFIDLPLKPASAQDQEQAVMPLPQEQDIAGLSILVVDDNATNRLILSRFLSGTSAQVRCVKSGEEALAECRDQHFDVVLMDVQMPVMDGVAATHHIREAERRSGQDPAFIVAVTANVLSHQVAEYLSAGMDEVLGKPVSKRDLLGVLARHVVQRAA
jgi:signal transduction histidine kinase/ActR/RegA family two-component response regulator